MLTVILTGDVVNNLQKIKGFEMRINNKGFIVVGVPFVIIVLFILIFLVRLVLAFLGPEPLSTDIASTTNAGVLSVNWTHKTNASEPAENYQLFLPFSDYTRIGHKVTPRKHFQLNNGFHFAIPLLSKKDGQDNLPQNIDEAERFNTPFSIAFTPTASNEEQVAENTNWLSIEENKPQNTLTAVNVDHGVRLYKPVILKKDNQVIATVGSVVIEQSTAEQGNSINMVFNGMYSPIKMEGMHAGPGVFSFTLNNLDARLVHQLEKEVNDIKYLPKRKQILTELKMLKQISALCKKESTLTVDYTVHTATGPVRQHYSISLADITKAPALILDATP